MKAKGIHKTESSKVVVKNSKDHLKPKVNQLNNLKVSLHFNKVI